MSDQPVSDRLKVLRERAGLSIREMAAELGMKGSGYSHYELRFKGARLPLDKAEEFADVLASRGVDRGEVLSLAGLPQGENLPALHSDVAAVSEGVMVPIYDVQASAGPGTYVDHEVIADQLSFPPEYLRTITSSNPRNLAIIGVRGRSMLPTLNDGDVVMLDMSKRHLGFDGMFVLNIEGVLQVKRIGRTGRAGHVTIVSDNEAENPPYEVAIDDVTVVGRILWSGRRE